MSDDVRVAVAVAASTDDESAGLTRSFGSKSISPRSSSLDSLGAMDFSFTASLSKPAASIEHHHASHHSSRRRVAAPPAAAPRRPTWRSRRNHPRTGVGTASDSRETTPLPSSRASHPLLALVLARAVYCASPRGSVDDYDDPSVKSALVATHLVRRARSSRVTADASDAFTRVIARRSSRGVDDGASTWMARPGTDASMRTGRAPSRACRRRRRVQWPRDIRFGEDVGDRRVGPRRGERTRAAVL